MSFESLRPLNTHCFQLRPIDPGRPRGPWGPWIPCSPSSPFGPWGPGGPWDPWLPLSPGGPRGPSSPFSPGLPLGPAVPSGPGAPGDPVAPAGPGLPGMPGIPGMQLQPQHPQCVLVWVLCWEIWMSLFFFFGSLNVGLSTTRENSKSKGSVKNLSMHTISFSITLHSERAKGMFPLNKPLTNFFFRYNNYNFCHSSVCNFKLRNVILRNIAVL